MERDNHDSEVIMRAMAFQITGISIVYSAVFSSADQRKQQRSASLAFARESTGDRWIPPTKGQYRGFFPIWLRHHDDTIDMVLWQICHTEVYEFLLWKFIDGHETVLFIPIWLI